MTDPAPETAVFTLGHGDRDASDLLACLSSFSVETVVDVRSYPASRRHPQFDRETLEAALSGAGFRYRWLGEGLGGLRSEGFASHMRSRAFSKARRQLAAMARSSTVAILCAERDPALCHRRLIGESLVREGFTVRHIESPGRLFPPLRTKGGQGTLFPVDD